MVMWAAADTGTVATTSAKRRIGLPSAQARPVFPSNDEDGNNDDVRSQRMTTTMMMTSSEDNDEEDPV